MRQTNLVLSRKVNEPIIMTMPDGRVVTVTPCQVNGNRVKLQFNAPEDVIIHRQEVLEKIQSKI